MDMIIREAYLKRIRPVIDNELVKILTGMRRCGKSVLLSQIAAEIRARGVPESRIISLNFEDLDNLHLCDAIALHSYIKEKIGPQKGKFYVFLDEIQLVDKWEVCVNSLRVSLDCDIYITGSNAKLLSGELATYLAGRYIQFEVYPFSFKEFISDTSVEPAEVRAAFLRYKSCGGIPMLRSFGYEKHTSKEYLLDLFSSVMLKDIILRNNIRNSGLLERFLKYMAVNDGQPFSSLSISKYLKSQAIKVTPETLLNYLKVCCDSFLLKRIPRYDIEGKQMLASSEKYYLCDHALHEVIAGEHLKEEALLLENIVAVELLRRGYEVYTGKAGKQEIDFVAIKDARRIYVQVCYLLASPETVEREFSAFAKVTDHSPCYVVSMDESDMSRDGIIHLPIWEFLLKDTLI